MGSAWGINLESLEQECRRMSPFSRLENGGFRGPVVANQFLPNRLNKRS